MSSRRDDRRKRKSDAFYSQEDDKDDVLYREQVVFNEDETERNVFRGLSATQGGGVLADQYWMSQTQGSASYQTAKQPAVVLIPRHERKQKQIMQQRRGNDFCPGSNSDGSEEEDEQSPPENAFASLESLLEQDNDEGEPPTSFEKTPETDLGKETFDLCKGGKSSGRLSGKELSLSEECSPLRQSEDEDMRHLQENMIIESNGIPSNTSRYEGSDSKQPRKDQPKLSLDKTTQHKNILDSDRKQRNDRKLSSSRKSLLDKIHKQKSSSLFEKSRRAAMKVQSKEILNAAGMSNRERPKAGPVAMVDPKSIVGSRPKHWKAPGIRGDNPREMFSLLRGRKSQLAAELAKATTKSHSHLMQPRQPRSLGGRRSIGDPLVGDGLNATGSGSAPVPTPGARGASTAPARPVTFTPSFLTTSRAKTGPVVEPVLEDDANVSLEIGSVLSPLGRAGATSPVPPPPRRSRNNSNKKVGPLAKRLKVIRDAVKGDSIRFRSGQYPFSERGALEMNDPRNRSKSHMDVTVLGDALSWDKDYQRLTVLGCIHSHVVSRGSGAGNNRAAPLKDNAQLMPSSLAWICFSYETAQEHRLRTGSQLRIYNAVVFPIPSAPIVPEHGSAKDGQQKPCMPCVKSLVACTQLCELYPQVLPDLPGLALIATTHGLNIQATH